VNNLTDKTFCLVTRSGIEMWLTPEEADLVKGIMRSGTGRAVEVDGELINLTDVVAVLTAQRADEYHKLKRGLWLCKYDEWHTKNQTCECAEARRYENHI